MDEKSTPKVFTRLELALEATLTRLEEFLPIAKKANLALVAIDRYWPTVVIFVADPPANHDFDKVIRVPGRKTGYSDDEVIAAAFPA